MNRKFYCLILIVFALGNFACASGGGRQVNSTVTQAEKLMDEPTVKVKVGRGRRGVMTLPMETYLAGVIGNEMSRKWPREALKAQSVAARSYALARMGHADKTGRRFDVTATQSDQVFKARDINNEYLRSITEETRGIVLWKNGQVVPAFYSSTCGGVLRTAAAAGLSNDYPIKECINDNYCKISPFRSWQVTLPLSTIDKKIGLVKSSGKSKKRRHAISHGVGLKEVSVKERDSAGYAEKLLLTLNDGSKKEMKAESFRYRVGSMQIKSLLFNLEVSNGQLIVRGNGFGHGVGMCQYGAFEMSKKHKNYRSILSKYYPGIPLKKIY